jgi:predicted SAM-dependent methyltransferase
MPFDTNAIPEYETAHELMVKHDIPIDSELLRDYLDTMRAIRSAETNEYQFRVITVSGEWVNQFPETKRGNIMRMIYSLASEFGFEIRVRGQRW